MTISPAFLAATSAETIGYWVGASLMPILLMVSIYSCVAIARRDITSSKCVNGLALVLLGILFFMLVGLGEMAGADRDGLFVFGLMPLAGVLSLVLGMIVALVGLVEYRRIKPPLRQGRKQAVTALVLGGTLVAAVVGVTLNEIDFEKSPFAGLGHTEPQTFEDLNFRFKAPPIGWMRLDVRTVNEEASVAYGRLSGEVFFMLIAERLGIELGMSSDDLREIAEENMREASALPRIDTPRPIRHDGLDGVRFEAAATSEGTRFFYVYHVFSHNGFGYQLITYGEHWNREAVKDDAETMLALFDCIDPERLAVGEGATLLTARESERLGYAVDLPGEGWFTSEDLRETYAEEDFVASYRDLCWLSVIALPFKDDTVPDTAILRGLLSLKYYEYPENPIENVAKREDGGHKEIRFTYAEDVEGEPVETLARVIRANGFVYLIESERFTAESAAQEMLPAALDSVRTIPPQPDELTENEQRVQAQFLNRIGLHYYEADQSESALKWFIEACRCPKPSSSFIDNASQALVRLDRLDDALEHLDRYREFYVDDLDLRGDRAWLLAENGKQDEARTEYAALFAAGLRDVDDLNYYAKLLVSAGQADRAIELVKNYRAVEDDVGLIVIQARVLVAAEKPKEARTLLLAQSPPHPPQILDALIDVYEATGEHPKLIASVNALLKQDYNYLKLFQSKARAEIAMGQFATAKETITAGLAGFPEDPVLVELGQQAERGSKKK